MPNASNSNSVNALISNRETVVNNFTDSHTLENVNDEAARDSQQFLNSIQDVRFKLMHSLQCSLDLDDVLGQFFNTLQSAIHCSSLAYEYSQQVFETELGSRRAHSAHYNLTIEGFDLGKLLVSRSKKFSENELEIMESLTGTLLPSLKNCLLYREALANSLKDSLTQIGNRTAMESAIKRELSISSRSANPMSLIVADIDYFKRVNDSYGHHVGDELLVLVANTLKNSLRDFDQVFRFGGEEFVIVLGQTSHQDAMTVAERMREAVEKVLLPVGDQFIGASISLGVSTSSPGESRTGIFQRTDQALYEAKNCGRNCVRSSEMMTQEVQQA